MLESLEYYARIDRFYQNELLPEEKTQLETDLATDPQLKKEFVLDKELDELLLKVEMIEFRKLIADSRKKTKRLQNILKYSLLTCISLVLVSVISYLILNGFNMTPIIKFFRHMH